MKPSHHSLLLKYSLVFLLLWGTRIAFADDAVATPSNSSTQKTQNKNDDSSDSSSTLIVHKPATDPAWGKVIQYQEEKSVSAVDKTEEALYKFVFQDSNGIVRVCVYHETASGTGYWEVRVWDQP